MKKYLILTAMAVVMAAPCYAQDVSSTRIKQTDTAVERAAREQGFVNAGNAPAGAASGASEMSAPPVIENSSVLMMAPQAPEGESSAAPAATPARPALVTDGLPPGLVLDGPGTEAYKKKHRRKKAKKAATEQVKPAEEKPVAQKPAEKFAAPEPAPAEPEAMPDANAMPPADEMPEPTPAPETAPAPAPEQQGAMPEQSMPEPAMPDPSMPQLEPAPLGTPAPAQDDNDPLGMPGLQPGVPHPGDARMPAPSNPFAP